MEIWNKGRKLPKKQAERKKKRNARKENNETNHASIAGKQKYLKENTQRTYFWWYTKKQRVHRSYE